MQSSRKYSAVRSLPELENQTATYSGSFHDGTEIVTVSLCSSSPPRPVAFLGAHIVPAIFKRVQPLHPKESLAPLRKEEEEEGVYLINNERLKDQSHCHMMMTMIFIVQPVCNPITKTNC